MDMFTKIRACGYGGYGLLMGGMCVYYMPDLPDDASNELKLCYIVLILCIMLVVGVFNALAEATYNGGRLEDIENKINELREKIGGN